MDDIFDISVPNLEEKIPEWVSENKLEKMYSLIQKDFSRIEKEIVSGGFSYHKIPKIKMSEISRKLGYNSRYINGEKFPLIVNHIDKLNGILKAKKAAVNPSENVKYKSKQNMNRKELTSLLDVAEKKVEELQVAIVRNQMKLLVDLGALDSTHSLARKVSQLTRERDELAEHNVRLLDKLDDLKSRVGHFSSENVELKNKYTKLLKSKRSFQVVT
ncbi:hypothetical protein [Microbulbifer sp. MCCC 1A16149]|uniref:hypothetical protein n=1 Tax=Microbulbifer sp. MCCC 1A16149 TaxID=3411322 RepID=UPI003D11BF48